MYAVESATVARRSCVGIDKPCKGAEMIRATVPTMELSSERIFRADDMLMKDCGACLAVVVL
jgi:hypothetical protein